MNMKVHFDKDLSLKQQLAIAAQIEADIVQAMQYAGESFVRDARRMTKGEGGFGDVTKNLRSSIGYFILKDGKIVNEDFEGNSEGFEAAKRALFHINYNKKGKGWQLIGIAGMNYASHVESRGMNVISKQADAVIIDLKDYFKEIENKYGS